MEKVLVPISYSVYNGYNSHAEYMIEVTDGTRNRATLMPGRHSPPLDAEIDAAEPLKRPKKSRKRASPENAQSALTEEESSLSPSPVPKSTPPENLNTPAFAAPSTLSDPTGPTQGNDLTASTAEDLLDIPAAPTQGPGPTTFAGIAFHHDSEAEFGRLLDYYGIEWQYEPNQFPLQWRDDRPIEMFAPDFYLTEYDLYIELTTMRQALVRRKNRKLRLLRALYPEINVKLLYRRDYQRLLERFGIRPDGELDAEQTPE